MQASSDRILTTHVGSLVRPPALLELLRAGQSGADDEAFAACLRESVADAVRKQAEAGIDIVSDGELGKSSFLTYAHDRLSGFSPRTTPVEDPVRPRTGRDRSAFPEFYAEYDQTQGSGATAAQLACTGPIAYTGQAMLQRDLDTFKSALADVSVTDGFVAAIAPGNFGRGENEHYRNEEEFIFASAEALKVEYEAIVDAGFILQIDAPVGSYDLAALSKEEFRRRLSVAIEALNGALAGIPPERVRYHVCWGSWNAPHTFDIPLVDIIDLVLGVRAAGISLEAANPRHEHEFHVWEQVKLPEGKVLLPGLISHATNIVEHPELVAWRIQNFAQLVGRERVIASTDCGFAQGAFIRRVHPSIMWAKLQALAEGARLASRGLWPGR